MANKIDSIEEKLKKAKEELEKARKRLSDEYDPNEDPYGSDGDDELGEGFHEFDPDEEESAGEDWLKENDPNYQGEKYDEYDDEEDEDVHRRSIEEDLGDDDESPTMGLPEADAGAEEARAKDSEVASPSKAPEAEIQTKGSAEEVSGKKSRFRQPTREELMGLRAYTRPWEQRARETAALKAEPSVNPQLAYHGDIVEARNKSHGDRSSAYREFINSTEYKNADPITQMEMDDQFEKKWHSENPEHLKNALQAHHEAHTKGGPGGIAKYEPMHYQKRHQQIQHILSGGGHGGEGYKLEEGMQHAGGARGEEGTQATVKQDPAASFAMGNQDFIRQYAADYDKKSKKVANIDDMHDYNEGSKRDIARILGEAPQKDPKFEQFFSHYYPLIGMNAHKTLARLGLDPKHPDIDMSMLHEAGMHGLIQAINDYDHDNPGKASFSTHAANKIRGLQMTAMKNQDAIPTEVRQAQKKFASYGSAAPQQKPKVDLQGMISQSNHPKATDMADRLKRVAAHRQAQASVKVRKGPGSGQEGGGL